VRRTGRMSRSRRRRDAFDVSSWLATDRRPRADRDEEGTDDREHRGTVIQRNRSSSRCNGDSCDHALIHRARTARADHRRSFYRKDRDRG